MISLVALWAAAIGAVVVANWNWHERINKKRKYANKG